jgi:hypothetical protein
VAKSSSSAGGAAAVEEPKPRRARAARGMAGPARRMGRGRGRVRAPECAAKSGREEAAKARRRGKRWRRRPAAIGGAPSP